MLDKSVPYMNIIMCRKSGLDVPDFELPMGYSFVRFKEGDEQAWAEIEASVFEFDSVAEALHNFRVIYMPYIRELKRRTIFIENHQGQKVATFTNWWDYQGERRIPSVHWVAVKPAYQGIGLGKAIILQGLHMGLVIEGDHDIYLHTQTWSHRAIDLYLKAGFEFVKEGSFSIYDNDYHNAQAFLKEKGFIQSF